MPTIAIRIFDPHSVVIVAAQVVPQPQIIEAVQLDACPSLQDIRKNPKAHLQHLEREFRHVRRVFDAAGPDAKVVVDLQASG